MRKSSNTHLILPLLYATAAYRSRSTTPDNRSCQLTALQPNTEIHLPAPLSKESRIGPLTPGSPTVATSGLHPLGEGSVVDRPASPAPTTAQ